MTVSRRVGPVEGDGPVWLRPLIIVVALLASALLAFWPSEIALLAPLGIVAAVVVYRQPPLGLLGLVVAALFVPWGASTGTKTNLNAVVVLLPALLGLWAVRALAERPTRTPMPRYLVPLLGLCLVSALSFVHGSEPLMRFVSTAPLPAQLAGLAIFVLSGGAFLLARSQLRDVRWLARLTWLFLALGGLYMVGRLVPELGFVTGLYVREVSGGAVFWVWLVALAFGQALCNRTLSLGWRLATLALGVVTLGVGFFEARDWVSGWLPPLVAAALVLWVARPRLAVVVGVALGVVVALYYTEASRVGGAIEAENAYSSLTRLEAWRIIGQIVAASPWLGVGPANYYWYTPSFPILGWYVSFSSHNNYIDIAAQTGLVGLGLFVWFAFEMVLLGVRLTARAPTGFARAYAVAGLAGLVGTLVAAMLADWLLPFTYNIGLSGFRISVLAWVFVGGMAALEQTVSADGALPEPSVPERGEFALTRAHRRTE